MKQLEKNIGYHFRDKNLLKTAVTHSSYANENRGGMAYNERLEFLGDAVLQLITSEKLFKENGIFNKEVANSFRKHVLSKGGTEHPMTLYKRFRGQSPDIQALLKRNGIV